MADSQFTVVIISADVMKKKLFYVAAGRGRSEIAVVTSDC
jgi:ATP-dependent exoDNAse (exonuclease V) alpha subunit